MFFTSKENSSYGLHLPRVTWCSTLPQARSSSLERGERIQQRGLGSWCWIYVCTRTYLPFALDLACTYLPMLTDSSAYHGLCWSHCLKQRLPSFCPHRCSVPRAGFVQRPVHRPPQAPQNPGSQRAACSGESARTHSTGFTNIHIICFFTLPSYVLSLVTPTSAIFGSLPLKPGGELSFQTLTCIPIDCCTAKIFA